MPPAPPTPHAPPPPDAPESDVPSAAHPRSKARHDAQDAFFGYYPGPVAVVTARHGDAVNVMSAGWHAALSAAPPLYGVAIAPERHTHALVAAAGAFAVHFLPIERADAVQGAGVLSGADVPDKLAALNLAWREGDHGLPILEDAYLAYACTVRERHPAGDHDWFVGDVTGVYADADAYADRLLDAAVASPAIYYGRSRYEGLGHGPVRTFDVDALRALGRGATDDEGGAA